MCPTIQKYIVFIRKIFRHPTITLNIGRDTQLKGMLDWGKLYLVQRISTMRTTALTMTQSHDVSGGGRPSYPFSKDMMGLFFFLSVLDRKSKLPSGCFFLGLPIHINNTKTIPAKVFEPCLSWNPYWLLNMDAATFSKSMNPPKKRPSDLACSTTVQSKFSRMCGNTRDTLSRLQGMVRETLLYHAILQEVWKKDFALTIPSAGDVIRLFLIITLIAMSTIVCDAVRHVGENHDRTMIVDQLWPERRWLSVDAKTKCHWYNSFHQALQPRIKETDTWMPVATHCNSTMKAD